MTRLSPVERLLRNLEGRIPRGRRAWLHPDEALRQLRALTGHDAGPDPAAWRAWFRTEGRSAR